MKILITSGGTREYIDEVRVLTNISSGKLGAIIGEKAMDRRHFVTYAAPKEALVPGGGTISTRFWNREFINSADELMEYMKNNANNFDVIIHCMAVSDFGFKPLKSKLKSDSLENFIQSIKDRIKINPKILSHIRKWSPNCLLVSFKFEVGLTNAELIKVATDSLMVNDCDMVIANDKEEMQQHGQHIAYAIEANIKRPIVLMGKEKIAEHIINRLEDLSYGSK